MLKPPLRIFLCLELGCLHELLKFLVCFRPNSTVSTFWHSWRIIYFKNKYMRIWRLNCRVFELRCWTSTSKNHNLSFHGTHKILTFKLQSFFGGIFYSKICSKIHEIRWYSSFLDLLYFTSKSSWVHMVQISNLDLEVWMR
jgi:hypothetical protein